MTTTFPTLIIDDCFQSQNLQEIENEIMEIASTESYIHNWEGPNFGKKMSTKYRWNFSEHPKIAKKIIHGLGPATDCMIVQKSFILESFIPYEIHADYGWLVSTENEKPYYIILIPLDDTGSSTIILNQQGNLHFTDYKMENTELPVDQQMSDNEYQKYFSHCNPQERPYISIKDIFHWKIGSSLLFDAKFFHASDNFLAKGIAKKKCIVLMTTINI